MRGTGCKWRADYIPHSRTEAKRLGLALYMGKPCKHGHAGLRAAANGVCRACDLKKYRERFRNRDSNKPSKMIEIDRKKDEFRDDYYDMDIN